MLLLGKKSWCLTETKEADVKKFLEKYQFEIKIFDDDLHIGTATADLNKLYDQTSEKLKQRSFKENLTIFEPNSSKSETILGTIHCFFILQTQEYMACKVCKSIFKRSGRKAFLPYLTNTECFHYILTWYLSK